MSKRDDEDDYKYDNGIDWEGSDPEGEDEDKEYVRVFLVSQTLFVAMTLLGAWGLGDIVSTVYMGLTVA